MINLNPNKSVTKSIISRGKWFWPADLAGHIIFSGVWKLHTESVIYFKGLKIGQGGEIAQVRSYKHQEINL